MRTIIASRVAGLAGLLPLDLHVTPGSTVQRYSIPLRSHVVGLHDVDLTICGPIIPVRQPKRRP